MTQSGDFIDAIANGTADEAVTAAFWHLVKTLNRPVADLTQSPGSRLHVRNIGTAAMLPDSRAGPSM